MYFVIKTGIDGIERRGGVEQDVVVLVHISEIVDGLSTYGYTVEEHDCPSEKQLVDTSGSVLLILDISDVGYDIGVRFRLLKLITNDSGRSQDCQKCRRLVDSEMKGDLLQMENIVVRLGEMVSAIAVYLIDTEVKHESKRIPGCDGGRIDIIDVSVVSHTDTYTTH